MGLYGSHYYEVIVGNWVSNSNAKALAALRSYRGVSGHLVTISSAGEQSFVSSEIQTAVSAGELEQNVSFIDGVRVGATSSFAFTAGPPGAGVVMSYGAWDPLSALWGTAQPEVSSSNRNCIVILSNTGLWSDFGCASLASFVVEYECSTNGGSFVPSTGCCVGFRGPTCGTAIPTSASTLACVAQSPQRVGSAIFCTLTSIAGNGPTVGLASDFTVTANASSSGLVSLDGGATFTFSSVPSTATTAYFISVLANGSAISSGSPSFLVFGNPTTSSSLSCSNTNPARVGVTVTCTITVSGSNGATTGLASDFSISADAAVSGLTTSNGGSTFVFSTTPSGITSGFSIGAFVNGIAISSGSPKFAVYNFPTTASTLICANRASERTGVPITCTIFVEDANGPAKGPASDFSVSSSSTVSPLVTSNGGSTFTFSTTGATITTNFVIQVLVGGSAIVAGSQTFVIYGIPTAASSLSCSNTSPARVGTAILCTIAVSNGGGATTGLAPDFSLSALTFPTAALTQDGGHTFQFSVTPTHITTAFNVLVQVSGTTIVGGSIVFVAYGTPTSASSLTCENISPSRVSSAVICIINVAGVFGATTGVSSDFTISSTQDVSELQTPDGGSTFMFSTVPTTITSSFTITAQAQEQSLINGMVSFTVYGNPTTSSSLLCSPQNPLRYHVAIPCVITVSDDTGPTTTPASDFLATSTSSTSLFLSSSDDGFTYSFQTFPSTFTSSFLITTTLNEANITNGDVSFVVYGIPIATSTLVCEAMTPERTGEAINCTIIVSDSFGLVSGAPTDFVVTTSDDVILPLETSDVGLSYTFSATPTQIAHSYGIVATVGGAELTQGSQTFVVYGHPDETSKITCDAGQARVNGSAIVCKISVLSNGVPTTGIASDYNISFDGVPSSPILSTSNGGSSFSFLAPTPEMYEDAFTISAIVGSGTTSLSYRVYAASTGEPSAGHSVVSCLPTQPRVNSTISCTVSFVTFTGEDTSVVSSDISVSTNAVTSSRRRSLSFSDLLSVDGGDTYTFNVAAPALSLLDYEVRVYVSGHVVTSNHSEVFTYPTPDSLLTCVGQHSPAGFVHILENVTCTIEVYDAHGPALGLIEDFNITVNNTDVVVPLSTSNGGATLQFQVSSPNSSQPYFLVSAYLSALGPSFNITDVNLTVICEFLFDSR